MTPAPDLMSSVSAPSKHLTMTVPAANADDGSDKARAYALSHYGLGPQDLTRQAEGFSAGLYFVRFAIRQVSGSTAVPAQSGDISVNLGGGDTAAPGAAPPTSGMPPSARGGLRKPSLAIAVIQDEGEVDPAYPGGRWGAMMLPLRVPFHLVPVTGDSEDHDQFDQEDFTAALRGDYPDAADALLRKYRADSLVLVRYDSRVITRGGTTCLLQSGQVTCGPFSGDDHAGRAGDILLSAAHAIVDLMASSEAPQNHQGASETTQGSLPTPGAGAAPAPSSGAH